jgi:hypothetical protein
MSINVNTLAPPPSLATQVATQCLSNLAQSSKKEVVIDDSNNLGYKTQIRGWGEISLNGNTIPTNLTQNTSIIFTNINFIFNVNNSVSFTMSSPGRLQYNGILSCPFYISANVSCLSGSGNNQICVLYICINGTQLTQSKSQQTISNGIPQNANLQGITTLNTNDYIEVNLSNISANNPVTITDIDIVAIALN